MSGTVIFSKLIFIGALEQGFIYALVALALFLSFSILDIADLSTDGCFTLGCVVSAIMTVNGYPVLGLLVAILAGVCSGFVTAILQTKLGVESILAGIIVNTALYTINMAVMGFVANVNIFGCDTVFSKAKIFLPDEYYKLIIVVIIVIIVGVLLSFFLKTKLGLSIRATGDNVYMVRASSINPAFTITVGLCVANSLTALSGGILAQYQKSANIDVGTGMVTIGLASLIIGETLFGKRSIRVRIVGVVLGSCLYRVIIALALRLNIPADFLKLISASIVAIAIIIPYMKKKTRFLINRRVSKKEIENMYDQEDL
ncbi:ABC transporter permease [Lachnobacterium bovis]|uniref:Putative ABC transport system permease protein n=1 Tax=Lachnobacterium bovis TaxID=140626 RepID=A0A1H9QGY9_9FIRM|nr:ABC transporter permease [Lachnobacterium bovis]SER59698.1 putative ABC transport system permease protein [Lachnobacterium bovis]